MNFYRGCLIALPISLLLWWLILELGRYVIWGRQ